MTKTLKAIAGSKNTPLQIGSASLECYVLEDGTRVFSGNGLQKALEFPSTSGGTALVSMLHTGELKDIVSEEIKTKIASRKEFVRPGAGGSLAKTYGYDVTLLIDICDLLIEGRNLGILTERQKEYARVAEITIRSVAKVGIIALVDEVTGYQYDRERFELSKILKRYISEELLPWQKRFPDIFYIELFRLNGWNYTVNGIKKRPGVVGTWTKKLVYEQLPRGVLQELEKNTPKDKKGRKSAKMHQLLTEDIGNPHLTAQINQVVTLFQLSDSMQHMWGQFEKLKSRQAGQLEMPFEFDEAGHTISKEETALEKVVTGFDATLKQALNHNPKD